MKINYIIIISKCSNHRNLTDYNFEFLIEIKIYTCSFSFECFNHKKMDGKNYYYKLV